MNVSDSNYKYQLGGSLPPNAPTYVERQADSHLYNCLMEGKFCYVLNSRQMGKSSLRVRIMRCLQAAGFACAAIDITAIGTQQVTLERWYASLIGILVRSFRLEFRLKDWWREHDHLSPVNRLSVFIESVLLKEVHQNVVIFIDEVDSVLSLGFNVDDFFAFIRFCYNQRAENRAYNRLTFALFGVAMPSVLVQDRECTPFNIAHSIQLHGFQLYEVKPLSYGLRKSVNNPGAVLKEILNWTGGQPFLTQKLCALILSSASPIPEGHEKESVEKLVISQVIENWEQQDTQEHLRTIRDRLVGKEQFTVGILTLYLRILERREVTADNSLEQMELRLSGVVVRQQNKLRVYNRIYQSVFNQSWVEKTLADIRPYAHKLTHWLASHRRKKIYLLQGQELQEAKNWAAGKSLGEQDYQFLADSKARQVQHKTTTKIIVTVFFVFVFATSLLSIGWQSWSQKQQYQIVLADQLITQADLIRNQQTNSLQHSTLLSLEAIKRAPSVGIDPSLYKELSLLRSRRLNFMLCEQDECKEDVRAVALSQDGTYIAIARASADGTAQVWETASGKKVGKTLQHGDSTRYRDSIHAFAFSLDGSYIATASADGTAKVWETTSGEEVRELKHEGQDKVRRSVLAVTFTPDGKYVTTASADGTAKVWETTSGEETSKLKHDNFVLAVTFTPDGKYVATASADGTAQVWETTSGKKVGKPLQHEDNVTAVTFTPDGKYVATASADGTAQVWETTSGKKVGKPLQHEDNVTAVTFTPDGKYVATASADGTAKVWETTSGKKVGKPLQHEDNVTAVTFTPDGKYVATASADGTAKVWETTSGEKVAYLPHEESVVAVAFSLDGRVTTASWDSNNPAQMWDMNITQVVMHEQSEFSVKTLSPDGNYFVTAGNGTAQVGKHLVTESDNSAQVWEITSQLKSEKPEKGVSLEFKFKDTDVVNAAAFSPNLNANYVIATVSADNKVSVKMAKGNLDEKFPLRNTERSISALAISLYKKDLTMLATVDLDYTARVQNINSRKTIPLIIEQECENYKEEKCNKYMEFKDFVKAVTFSPEGSYLATLSLDNTVQIWEIIGSEKVLKSLRHKHIGHRDNIHAVTFSPDGNYIATASADGTAQVWKTTSGKKAGKPLQHGDNIHAVTFSPDGNYIATADDDDTVQVWKWDRTRGRKVSHLTYRGKVNAISFWEGEEDGSYLNLATVSNDNTVQVRPWKSQVLIDKACKYLTRNLTEQEWSDSLGNELYRKTCNNLPSGATYSVFKKIRSRLYYTFLDIL